MYICLYYNNNIRVYASEYKYYCHEYVYVTYCSFDGARKNTNNIIISIIGECTINISTSTGNY